MKTWEYFVETVSVNLSGTVTASGIGGEKVEMGAAQYLNLMGEHGWELVVAFRERNSIEFIFKKEKPNG